MAASAALRRALAFSRSSSSYILNPHKRSVLCYSPSLARGYRSNDNGMFLNSYVNTHLDPPLLNQWQRGFAKAKKSIDESTVEVVPNVGPTIKSTASTQMQAGIDALSRELSKLRTGRASAGMLDHIIIESDGVRTPLSRIAAISVLDSQTLSVTPYDLEAIKDVERAIVSSPLGLNPTLEGQRLVVPIPALTKEHTQAMSKLVSKASEDVKQSIRRARQKALDSIKKAVSSMSKDDVKRLEKEIDDLTKKFVKTAEDMCKAKEKEIMGK
uniref:Ribosome-recycling factor, chloroplastic n=1 Tax=Picea sitchensis TaxID=3332 RepID=A9NVE5_PICSI|nr:unknown [Picea sitchensis]